MNHELEDSIGSWSDEYINKKICEYEAIIQDLSGKEISMDATQTLLKEANGWIKLWAGPEQEVYDQYKYHLIATEEGVFRIIQGWNINTDPNHEEA